MAAIDQSAIVWSTEHLSGTRFVSGAQYVVGGWISGTAVTQTIDTSNDETLSVYIMASGAGGAPASAKIVDGIGGMTLASLIVPSTNGSSINWIRPSLSGANVANSIGYFNAVVPPQSRLEVAAPSQNAWFRVIIVGK